MAFFIEGSNFQEQFSCRSHLKKHVYVFPPRNIENLLARSLAAVTTVVVRMLCCVRGICVLHIAVCLTSVSRHSLYSILNVSSQ
jgi:hypothetical protein